ncbi:MAG TPA: CAP domain-containing protein [Candidatus Limnocylindrales bacterium]
MESHAKLVARRLAIVAGLLVGPGIVATAAPADAAYVPSAATVAAYEARVIYQINVQRVKYAHGKLKAGTCPDKYAETWAAYLARTRAFYHRDMTTILVGCSATRAAENLARGYSADGTVVAWMASPGHRANVLDGSLTRIGVAAVYANGQWTVAADFTRG